MGPPARPGGDPTQRGSGALGGLGLPSPKVDSTPSPLGGAAAWARLCPGPGVLQVGSHSLSAAPGRAPAARRLPLCGEPRPSPVVRLRVQHLRDGGRQRALEARGAVLAAAAWRPGRCEALPGPRRPRGPSCSASAPAPSGPPPGRPSEGVTPGPGRRCKKRERGSPGQPWGLREGPAHAPGLARWLVSHSSAGLRMIHLPPANCLTDRRV